MAPAEREYLLFVAQNAGFQCSTLLLPADEFLAVRGAEWRQLVAASEHDVQLEGQTLDNVLWVRFEHAPVGGGSVQRPADTPWLPAHHMLFCYAEHGADLGLQHPKDVWVHSAATHLAPGHFNPVQCYARLWRAAQQGRLHHDGHRVRIVEGLLSLELSPGQTRYQPPPWDTAHQMLITDYLV